jgi:hypothetical protein
VKSDNDSKSLYLEMGAMTGTNKDILIKTIIIKIIIILIII